jgi:hypothetical protein
MVVVTDSCSIDHVVAFVAEIYWILITIGYLQQCDIILDPHSNDSLPLDTYYAQNISQATIDFTLKITWVNVSYTGNDLIKHFLPGNT